MDEEKRMSILEMRARKMRKQMTPQEGKLWHLFLKWYPIRFRRQVILGTYIMDFFCTKAKLAIEIDGSQHYLPYHKIYDARRTRFIESHHILVIRFTNREIDSDIGNVKEFIHEMVQMRLKESADM